VLGGYLERHHVVPRCMGGGNEKANLVELTPEEHYVAHQLLVKKHPFHLGLVRAAHIMSQKHPGNRVYGWMRRRYAKLLRGNKYRLGKKFSAETLEKMSASQTGRKHTEETKAKIGEAHAGKVLSPEYRAKISATLTGRPVVRSAEGTARIAAAARKRMLSDANPWRCSAKRGPLSAVTRAKIGEALRGRHSSEATKKKLSLAKRGKKHSAEHAARLTAHLKAYWKARHASEAKA
jgi:hypothetical protein